VILARSKINDFDQFWSVFQNQGADHRVTFNSRGSQVFRDQENPNEVWVLFDWSREDFERFIQDDKTKEIMAQAGLQGPPEPIFVDSLGEVRA
jgi:hypothetical protein